jgi:hypothetical protein
MCEFRAKIIRTIYIPNVGDTSPSLALIEDDRGHLPCTRAGTCACWI